ncbi:unnamed protein product [Microthlaspi erraticum]|uniref:non-specific serine/threonine protein kinase n=1 Tax=Microthlaspi erraticum TaxID=1685480 RepID=A0A6D2LK31_9BRAS|nr:unnamed protein product [Microthlaspi erraticum]
MEKEDWDFSNDPCSGKGNWNVSFNPLIRSSLTCDCSFHPPNSSCHVIAMVLTSQNLTGIIPPEFSELRYLKSLTLSRNCLTGSIPKEWASMGLEGLSLLGNRLSGPFPEVLTRVTSLRILYLSSNSFTGPLPEQFGQLRNLSVLTISDNNFTGRVPDFIGNWTQIRTLEMLGSGLDGPLPSSISSLTRLNNLKISDLGGKLSSFPPLKSLISLNTLELRRCNINGQLPNYIGDMTGLKTLDLSFNLLTGKIPSSLPNIKLADYVYLSGNKFTGDVPNDFIERNKNIDLSSNYFTVHGSLPTSDCDETHNAYKGFSCYVQHFPCFLPKRDYKYKLYINCGGDEVRVDPEKTYEANVEGQRASTFVYGPDKKWGFSSTGNFMNELTEVDDYTVSNTSTLLVNGRCCVSQFYALQDRSDLSSVVDLLWYLPGQRRIHQAAGGSGKPIIKKFVAHVTNNSLKISLAWAGKGTTSLPIRGVYGPMISAITVEPNFKPPEHHDHGKNNTLLIVGIVVAAVVVVVALIVVVCLWKRRRHKNAMEIELKGLDLQTGVFSLRHIKAATNNFDAANKIGEGGFGPVYKGVLSEGRRIAVKKLSSTSKQGRREFVNELGMISSLQHPNLVKLYGCCVEKKQLILVYEYLANNCLSRALFGKDERSRIKLEWPTRKKICLGIARGLTFLHEESVIKIVHRDIKASNVLLDEHLNAKISDFGLAKLTDEENTHSTTRIAGTYGYMAPEYAMHGHLTEKADVYSFGVIALEIVSGKSNSSVKPSDELEFLLDHAYVMKDRGCLLDLVDPVLGSDFAKEEAMLILNVALMCTNKSPGSRPKMSQVVKLIEGKTAMSDPKLSAATSKHKALTLRTLFWQSEASTSGPRTTDSDDAQENTSKDEIVEEPESECE